MEQENILKPQKPENIMYSFRGFADNEESIKSQKDFAEFMNILITEMSKHIDIRSLDGITIAQENEYDNALAELNRGTERNKLIRSTGEVIGVAITPAVIRNNEIKSHIIYNYNYISDITNTESNYHYQHLYTFTHELAHVEITNVIDKCFPNTILREKIYDLIKGNHSLINMTCIEEYCACRISGGLDKDNTIRDMYEETLINYLSKIEVSIENAIIQYKKDNQSVILCSKMYAEYGNLLKYASYYFGHIENQEFNWESSLKLVEEINNNIWFKSYFMELKEVLNQLWLKYNQWGDKAEFDVISNIAKKMINEKVEFLILFNRMLVKIK